MAENSPIKELLNQLGIEKIIWIDDKFSSVEDATFERHLTGMIHELRDSFSGPELLSTLMGGFDKAPSQIQDKLVIQLLADSTGKFQTLEDQLDQLKARIGLPRSDLASSTFQDLITSAVEDVTRVSLAQWRKIPKEDKEKYARCLFLVDRQFTREGGGLYAGDEIIHEIAGLACTDYFCIMFTYTADQENEDATRREILNNLYTKLQVKKTPINSSFHVLAKSRIQEVESVEPSFAEALKHACLRSLHTRLVTLTEEAMASGVSESATELTNLSIYDIDRSVFLNSLTEGASEVDVIFRLLALGQRRKIEDLSAQCDVNLLEILGKLRTLQLSLPNNPPAVLTETSPIKCWRQAEILVRGAVVNNMHAPLACGDIFAKATAGGSQVPKKYALLCQPCDLMVRDDGSSKGKEAFFVEVSTVKDGENLTQYNRPFYYLLSFPGGAHVFDFRSWGSVSIEVLRLAVFNKDGKVEFSHGFQMPAAIHLPGWKKLFLDASNRFRIPANAGPIPSAYATLSLNENIKGRKPIGNQGSVVFPFTRDSRVRTPYAEAILSSFLNYSMRAAFDHDFAATGQTLTPAAQ